MIVLALNAWTLHCLYKNLRMSWLGRVVDLPFRLLCVRRSPFARWSFDYDNYCSLPELCRMLEAAGLRVTEKKGGTIGAPWVFHSFAVGRLIQRYAYRPLRWYFGICRWLEDRLGRRFPFRHLMDKVVVKGAKQRALDRERCPGRVWACLHAQGV